MRSLGTATIYTPTPRHIRQVSLAATATSFKQSDISFDTVSCTALSVHTAHRPLITCRPPLSFILESQLHARIMYVSRPPPSAMHFSLTTSSFALHAGLNLMTHIFPVAARPPTPPLKTAEVAAMQKQQPFKPKLTTPLVL